MSQQTNMFHQPLYFSYLQWRRLKTDTPYDIGDMSYHLFHT